MRHRTALADSFDRIPCRNWHRFFTGRPEAPIEMHRMSDFDAWELRNHRYSGLTERGVEGRNRKRNDVWQISFRFSGRCRLLQNLPLRLRQ